MKDKLYLKTGEVAKMLGVDRTTLQKWAKSGILIPAHKTGAGYNLYTRQQIKEFCQTAQNLTAAEVNCGKSPSVETQTAENLPNCGKSPSIKNRTATALQRVVKRKKRAKKSEIEVKEKRKSIRVIPARTLVMTNDKLSKELFRCTPEEYLTLFEAGGELVEFKNHPKVGDIITPYWLELVDNYTDKSPLTMFAKAVFTACISEWITGNRHTTDAIIFRHITGKRGTNAQPSPSIKKLILFCIRKMMGTILRVDMTEVCKHLKYNDGFPLILNAPILPCKYVEEVINGQESRAVIYFFDESPLLTIARAKNNQLLSVEPRLLNVANQSNTSKNISVRHCVIQRVLESILHKLKPIISFDYVFRVCVLMNADYEKKHEVIQEVIEIFGYLKSGGDLKDFKVNRDGEEYISVEFTLFINDQ